MCKTYGKEPDDPWFEKIDPVKWLWMYRSWLEDLVEKHKFAKDYSILTGSFSNLEMAQNMIGADNPDFQSTEEDFDKSTQMVLEARNQPDTTKNKKSLHRRKRRHGVVNGRTNS